MLTGFWKAVLQKLFKALPSSLSGTLVDTGSTQTVTGDKTFTGGQAAITVGTLTTPDATSDVRVSPSGTAQKGIIIQGTNGQTAPLYELQIYDGAAVIQQEANATNKAVTMKLNYGRKLGFSQSGSTTPNVSISSDDDADTLAVTDETDGIGTYANLKAATLVSTTNVQVSKTITAPGTTGNQTINKTAGRVNFAGAAGTALVVTNSLVTANSIVLANIMTNDATAVIKSVVVAAGSFTINLTVAATAETAVNWLVIN